MVVILLTTTTLLMFLAFGSLVLPIKAAVMSALTLGSTMGILTWIFVDGHGSDLMNFTPQPLMAPMIGLIIAVVFGSVDRLRGVPGVPHGGGTRAWHVHRRGHPDRHRDHRPHHHRARRWSWPWSPARSSSPTW